MKLRLYYRSILIALSLLFSGVTPAQAEQWYHVELIVFEQLSTVSDEQWPAMTELPTAPLAPTMSTPIIQPAQTDTLNSVALKLARSPNYRVYYHQAWQQPLLDKHRAKAVQVHSADDAIDGDILLYKATYLHADLDLWLKQQLGQTNSWSDTSPQGVALEAPRNPNLKQERRIRSREMNYFDHPKLGAILELTPVDTPDAAISEITAPESYSLPTDSRVTESQ